MSDRVLDELGGMGKAEVLSFVEARHTARCQAEREVLAAAYQWAVLHNPDTLAPYTRRAADRARPAGAAGTPLITEYAPAAFGARIQTSPYGAKRLIADAVDLHHRLPRLQAGITAGTVRVANARHVASATRDLTPEEAAWVDREVYECADGRLAWTRFEALVEGKVAAAAPETARAKERDAAMEVGARVGRVNKHGMATFVVKADLATIAGIDAAVGAVALQLTDTLPEASAQERRVAAIAMLANPAAHTHLDASVGAVKVKTKLYLHLTPDSPVARVEDHGPLTREAVAELLARVTTLTGRTPKVHITPVLDPVGMAPVDAYEIPARLREAVRLLHPGDVFPFAASLARAMDLDHAVPYSEGGATSVDNLGPLTRTHHRIKTHDNWEVRHPFPGVTIWRDPYGAHYLVDPTGTRRITTTPGDTAPRLDTAFTQILLNHAA